MMVTHGDLIARWSRLRPSVALLAVCLASACTGMVGMSTGGEPAGAGGAGAGVATGTGGGPGSTVGTGGTSVTGLGGAGNDPNAIPATPPAAVLVPTPRMARLSRAQWANSVRDLLKLTDISDIEGGVSGDALVGFDNEVEALYVGETLRADLAAAAEKLGDRIAADATALARLVPAGAPTAVAARGRTFITAFGQRAYRRPLTDAEITQYVNIFSMAPTLYPGVDAFTAGANLVIQTLLQSPHFLYRTELSTTVVSGKVPLSDYEVGAKLSYALTNTMPDDALMGAAAAGQLKDPAMLAAQARRLIDSPAGTTGRENFHLQVFRLGTYDGIVRDRSVFPDFTPETPAAMRREVLLFLGWVFNEGRGVKDIFTSPVGFVNSALAPIYGLPATGFTSDTFTKVDLDPSQRSGLLTQAGFLSSYAVANDPDSIHRGVFVNQRILCVKLPPPDPNATILIPLQPNMTNRERVDATTGPGTCGQNCHSNVINPAGFAFEAYDAIGKFRTTDRNKPINSADTYRFADGLKSFADGIEFSRLVGESKQAHACYAQSWSTYLNGRVPTIEEGTVLDYYARVSRAGMMSVRDLVLAVVTSDSFINRLP